MIRYKTVASFLLGFMVITGVVAAQTWQIAWGTAKEQVAFYNANSPGFAEDAAYGPMAMRVVQQRLWLLDSIGGRLLSFDEKGSQPLEIKISGLPDNVLLEDFALVTGSSGKPEAAWVADAAEKSIRKLSLANGRELVKVSGGKAGEFLQIQRLEVDRAGRLYVFDVGRQLLSIFTPYGEVIRELPCQLSGFVVDAADNLHQLDYDDNYGYVQRVYSPTGQLVRMTHIGYASLQNAKIWHVNQQGELLLSFIAPTGFDGKCELFLFAADTSIKHRCRFAPVASMNRYLAVDNHKIWLAAANFSTAPEGTFKINELAWDITNEN